MVNWPSEFEPLKVYCIKFAFLNIEQHISPIDQTSSMICAIATVIFFYAQPKAGDLIRNDWWNDNSLRVSHDHTAF